MSDNNQRWTPIHDKVMIIAAMNPEWFTEDNEEHLTTIKIDLVADERFLNLVKEAVAYQISRKIVDAPPDIKKMMDGVSSIEGKAAEVLFLSFLSDVFHYGAFHMTRDWVKTRSKELVRELRNVQS